MSESRLPEGGYLRTRYPAGEVGDAAASPNGTQSIPAPRQPRGGSTSARAAVPGRPAPGGPPRPSERPDRTSKNRKRRSNHSTRGRPAEQLDAAAAAAAAPAHFRFRSWGPGSGSSRDLSSQGQRRFRQWLGGWLLRCPTSEERTNSSLIA